MSDTTDQPGRPMTSTPPAAPPVVLDLPVGLVATGLRREHDSMGAVDVPADRYWGAQTQRALHHFAIGNERMPTDVHRAYGYLKKSTATANAAMGRLPQWKADLISRVCDEIITGDLDDHFPLHVWQSGSGTQTHMNVNEVIANRCIQLVGGEVGSKTPIHPNDDVNLGQSSNDTFPSAMHIAAHSTLMRVTLPAVRRLRQACDAKAELWSQVVRVGRTHLQDATPITVGQAFSGYVASLDAAIDHLEHSTDELTGLAIGGTAVGTGVNAPAGFDVAVTDVLVSLTGQPFRPASNKFAALATVDPMMRVHGALRDTAAVLVKIANDLRWLGSGPHGGIGELTLPANEPGSSIMPGKVNPTQAEALIMVCYRVMGADVTMGLAGTGGHFELNTCRPLVIATTLDSALALGDAADSFTSFMIDGAELNTARITEHLNRSVMLVTALAPLIGYDRAARIAHRATADGTTLRDAALADCVDAELFDRTVDPLAMTRPDMPDTPEDGPVG